MVWLAQPASHSQERQLAQTMADARAAEYADVLAEAQLAAALPEPERLRVMRRLRGELRRIHRRDYFPPSQRRAAERAVTSLHPDHTQQETA